eukprot:TRINITY_DN15849_c0_g1_i1.p1 TRINITY_DN15849_c0_g1~~TRINITY_DN15849_c0_g1_i1.p1  ORF type:complete len:481 (-),score=63.45 TRINITY_DN15849_c0_g1_i1:53-1447(-)
MSSRAPYIYSEELLREIGKLPASLARPEKVTCPAAAKDAVAKPKERPEREFNKHDVFSAPNAPQWDTLLGGAKPAQHNLAVLRESGDKPKDRTKRFEGGQREGENWFGQRRVPQRHDGLERDDKKGVEVDVDALFAKSATLEEPADDYSTDIIDALAKRLAETQQLPKPAPEPQSTSRFSSIFSLTEEAVQQSYEQMLPPKPVTLSALQAIVATPIQTVANAAGTNSASNPQLSPMPLPTPAGGGLSGGNLQQSLLAQLQVPDAGGAVRQPSPLPAAPAFPRAAQNPVPLQQPPHLDRTNMAFPPFPATGLPPQQGTTPASPLLANALLSLMSSGLAPPQGPPAASRHQHQQPNPAAMLPQVPFPLPLPGQQQFPPNLFMPPLPNPPAGNMFVMPQFPPPPAPFPQGQMPSGVFGAPPPAPPEPRRNNPTPKSENQGGNVDMAALQQFLAQNKLPVRTFDRAAT